MYHIFQTNTKDIKNIGFLENLSQTLPVSLVDHLLACCLALNTMSFNCMTNSVLCNPVKKKKESVKQCHFRAIHCKQRIALIYFTCCAIMRNYLFAHYCALRDVLNAVCRLWVV